MQTPKLSIKVLDLKTKVSDKVWVGAVANPRPQPWLSARHARGEGPALGMKLRLDLGQVFGPRV